MKFWPYLVGHTFSAIGIALGTNAVMTNHPGGLLLATGALFLSRKLQEEFSK